MKFGVREICDVVLRAKSKMNVGSRTFYKNEPVLYFDSLTTSSLEGAATTVYAQGGRGNARLMAWEGERTLTFNMTDALISAESFMILSGAGLVDASASKPLFVHTTSKTTVSDDYKIIVPDLAAWNHKGEMLATDTAALSTTAVQAGKDMYNAGADIFIMPLSNGEVGGTPEIPYDKGVSYKLDENGNKVTEITCYGVAPNSTVMVDYYVKRTQNVKQVEITPDKFGGYFYLEASTLFREEATGRDLPAEFIIPRCKIQSNFTFTMSSSGDPSTFDFVLDAFPDVTKFDETTKVLAVLQIVEEEADSDDDSLTAQRPHVSVNDKVNPATSGNAEHKSNMYDFDDGNNGYARGNDTIASEEFRNSDPEIDANIPATADLLGANLDDLQSGVAIVDDKITGTSKYVTGYTGFSSNVAEQSGNYIALHADVAGADTVKAQLLRSSGQKPAVTLDDDRIIIFRLTPTDTVTGVKITGTKDGVDVSKTFAFDSSFVFENA